MLTNDELFYKKIIEPLGYRAREKNEAFNTRKAEIINKFTKDFVVEFCDEDGKILWDKLVEFNSQNLTETEKGSFE